MRHETDKALVDDLVESIVSSFDLRKYLERHTKEELVEWMLNWNEIMKRKRGAPAGLESQARIDALEEVLGPFADSYDELNEDGYCEGRPDNTCVVYDKDNLGMDQILLGAFRKAKALLVKEKPT